MPTKIAYISITVVVLVLLPKLLLLLELLVLVLLLVLVFAVFTVLVWSVRTTLLLTPKPPGICASSSIGTGTGTIAGADDVVATIVAAGAASTTAFPGAAAATVGAGLCGAGAPCRRTSSATLSARRSQASLLLSVASVNS